MYSRKYVSYDIVETLLLSYFLVVFYANSNNDFPFLTVFSYTACPTKLNISIFLELFLTEKLTQILILLCKV